MPPQWVGLVVSGWGGSGRHHRLVGHAGASTSADSAAHRPLSGRRLVVRCLQPTLLATSRRHAQPFDARSSLHVARCPLLAARCLHPAAHHMPLAIRCDFGGHMHPSKGIYLLDRSGHITKQLHSSADASKVRSRSGVVLLNAAFNFISNPLSLFSIQKYGHRIHLQRPRLDLRPRYAVTSGCGEEETACSRDALLQYMFPVPNAVRSDLLDALFRKLEQLFDRERLEPGRHQHEHSGQSIAICVDYTHEGIPRESFSQIRGRSDQSAEQLSKSVRAQCLETRQRRDWPMT